MIRTTASRNLENVFSECSNHKSICIECLFIRNVQAGKPVGIENTVGCPRLGCKGKE